MSQQEGTSQTPMQPKTKRRWPTGIIILLTLFVVAAGVTAAIVLGYASVSVKNLGLLGTQPQVCDAALVERYNQASEFKLRDTSVLPTTDAAEIGNIKEDIATRKGNENDPTCQTIQFWIAISAEDFDGAKVASENVHRLYDRGQFASSNIRSNLPLFNYESALTSIDPSQQKSENPDD